MRLGGGLLGGFLSGELERRERPDQLRMSCADVLLRLFRERLLVVASEELSAPTCDDDHLAAKTS
jgi:hypothetical protein